MSRIKSIPAAGNLCLGFFFSSVLASVLPDYAHVYKVLVIYYFWTSCSVCQASFWVSFNIQFVRLGRFISYAVLRSTLLNY